MSKVAISDVAQALKDSHVDPAVLRRIIEQLNAKVEQAEVDSPESTPKVKTQHVILVSDPLNVITTPLAGWVFKIEEAGSPSTITARIEAAAAAYNSSKKGRLYPAKSIGEVIESVPKKHWQTGDDATRTTVVTKEALLVVTTSDLAINTQPRTT